jgi:hypothetical protein
MEYIFLLCALGLLSYLAVRRGRTTVRAALYLILMDDRHTVDDANNAALGTGYCDAAKLKTGVIRVATQPFGGRQLRMIAAARQRGFRG